MAGLGDRWRRFAGKTRFVVCRIFLHLNGSEVAPILGVLNESARQAIESEGDLEVMGEEMVKICQNLLQYDTYWKAAANEGNVFWDEGEAGDYVNELFTDSADRYLSQPELASAENTNEDQVLSLPVTDNIIIMITVASEGEIPQLEDDLASMEAMRKALKALINLPYQGGLRAVQIHFSPAQLGDLLTEEQVLINFPELIPL